MSTQQDSLASPHNSLRRSGCHGEKVKPGQGGEKQETRRPGRRSELVGCYRGGLWNVADRHCDTTIIR